MAALSTCAKSGLTPQVKHGGSGKDSFAIVGSKFDGTGLEKVHILHTHMPRSTWGEDARGGTFPNGLGTLETGEESDWPCAVEGVGEPT
jgi:hypothetical protein